MQPDSQDENQFPVIRRKPRLHIVLIVLAPFIFFIVAMYLINRNDFLTSESLPSDTGNQTAVAEVTPTLINADYSSMAAEAPPPTTLLGTGGSSMPTPVPTPAPILALGPLPTLSPVNPILRGLISHGNRTEWKIALTFDVGEREGDPAGFDEDIINVLIDKQIPATFFLGGLWMINNQESTKVLAANPLFEIGNHAWSHLDFAQISPEQMTSEIALTQQAMWELLGWQTKLFRLPFGTYTEEALDVIADYGMVTIQWDVVSGDPDPDITAERMIPWVLGQVQPGSIIIMHANGRGWHTAEALPTIIETLQEQGYTFTTVSEHLGLEAATVKP